jgi:hypothetical protein
MDRRNRRKTGRHVHGLYTEPDDFLCLAATSWRTRLRPFRASPELLITKNIRRLQSVHSLHTEVPNINNLGKLLSLKQQLKAFQMDGVLTQFWHS